MRTKLRIFTKKRKNGRNLYFYEEKLTSIIISIVKKDYLEMGQEKRDSDFHGQKRWYNKTNHLTFCFYVFHAFINVVLL